MVHTILFPSSFFDGKKIDEDIQNEYEAAIDTGLWEVVLFSYEKWFHDGVLVLSKEIPSPVTAVYRGWMMKEEQYASFYHKLQEKGITLVTDPKAYQYFHYFPQVYEAIKEDTPKMLAVPSGNAYSLADIQKKFDRFMVKDYVKSVKGTNFPTYFTKDTTEEAFRNAMELFYQYRGELLSGGLCFKEYVDLARYGKATNEYRVFYIENEIASVSRNSLQGNFTPQPPKNLLERYRSLPSPFYTLDYAELADGSWKILEAGDGSVSGPSEGQNLYAFYRALYQCLNHRLLDN
ncbi:ATP-grasp domain-containing protein [Kineothrix sp. MSJ-39]|uniref:ATP-grasp domain-containing protein n=1 Tax=Kineothrix sp. MSJ-39 TaxID=2841533 RepID=UPI001C10ABB2|nr:ATP-grasp domain-containing protein [Kineothrix sp. MSJ-39]MBU5430541.1 ATP-grasp domain-containing protein [Kineothrix sp. MSJ-39]